MADSTRERRYADTLRVIAGLCDDPTDSGVECRQRAPGFRISWCPPCLARGALDHTDDAEPEKPYQRTDGPVHDWFELTYSSYQVLPRVLMQSMPLEWQRRMVECLEQLREQFAHVEQAPGYKIEIGEWCYPDDCGDGQLAAAGVTRTEPDWDDPDSRAVYHDRNGTELETATTSVFVPGHDPLPSYRHGYVPPASDQQEARSDG